MERAGGDFLWFRFRPHRGEGLGIVIGVVVVISGVAGVAVVFAFVVVIVDVTVVVFINLFFIHDDKRMTNKGLYNPL